MNKRSDLLTYIPSLDGLRALSVLAVIVYHANKLWLPGGFLGVEVFFVISGYLITLLLLAESEANGTVSLKQFWLRRARRLLPALWVVVLGVVVFAAIFQRDILGTLRGDVVAALFYGFNWFQIWVGTSYFTSFEFVPLTISGVCSVIASATASAVGATSAGAAGLAEGVAEVEGAAGFAGA